MPNTANAAMCNMLAMHWIRSVKEPLVHAGVHLTQLRCEYLINPLGIDSCQPRLSWVLEGNGRSQRQSAYHIGVASSQERLARAAFDPWNSGTVESAQSAQIAYAGAALGSGMRCWWRVRVQDHTGQWHASEPSWKWACLRLPVIRRNGSVSAKQPGS